MKQKMIEKSIFRQLILFSLLISTLPVGIIFTILFFRMESMLKKELALSHQQIMSQYRQTIEEKINRYEESMSHIVQNTVILSVLEDKENNAHQKGVMASEEVVKSLLLESPSEIKNCLIYTLVEESPIYGSRITVAEVARRQPWYTKDKIESKHSFIHLDSDQSSYVLSMTQPIYNIDISQYTKRQIGFLKLDVELKRLLAPTKESSYQVIVKDRDGLLLYTSFDREEFQTLSKESQRVSPHLKEVITLETQGLDIEFFFEDQELSVKENIAKAMTLSAFVFVLLLAMISIYIYAKRFSKRIEALNQRFKDVEEGDLSIPQPIEGSDEIAQLDHKFIRMLEKLNQQIQRNYVQKLEKKEIQLRNLQLQINPHFLYNTLETISAHAAIHHLFPICDMCQKLGDIFRYSIGKNYGDYVSIREELHHVQNYIFIQQMRYPNQFQVFYNIEIDEEKVEILRFILQPIIENAILHGLSELDYQGVLEIHIYKEDNDLYLLVLDDGVGMSRQKVEALRKYISDEENQVDRSKSIGIRNVHQRIQLSCGSQYGIEIESQPGKGSSFKIKLPLRIRQ